MKEAAYENNIDFFISGLISYYLRSRSDLTIEMLAEKTQLSVSFISKAVSYSNGKHFNVRHIFLISQALGISIDKLFPSKESYKLLTNKALSNAEWNTIVENFKNTGEEGSKNVKEF